MSKQAAKVPTGMVVSKGASHSFKLPKLPKLPKQLRNKKVLVGIAVICVVLIGGAIYMATRQPENQKVAVAEDVSANFDDMDKSEVPAQIQNILGISANDLQHKRIDSHLLPTFNKSYTGAKALIALGDRKRALEAFALAEKQSASMDHSGIGTAQFYYDYASDAYMVHDSSLWHQKLDQAKQATDASTASVERKAEMNATISMSRDDWGSTQ